MNRLANALIPFLASGSVFLGLGARAAFAQCSHLSPPPVTDTPDDGFVDANTDGIDGMACGPIYVSPAGDDRNLGTLDEPMKTLGAAILAAKWFSPPRSVYVSSNGGYTETVVFVNGVHVYGGYHHTLSWARDNTPAPISGGVIAAWVEGLNAPVTLDRLAITAADNTAPGGLSIGLAARMNSALLDVVSCDIRGGNVIAGTPGTNGFGGASGNNGIGGNPGSCDGGGGTGGLGGSSPVGNTGGRGGDGGGECDCDGQTGLTGLGPAGGVGGTRGLGGNNFVAGGPGGNGQAGGIGANGANGTGGAVFYAAGGGGTGGVNGSGGGGGGGGGGQGGNLVNNGGGNGGGGGGGGGAAGISGAGGGVGGSSYGILAVATSLTASNGLILANSGANGGAGGVGATGAIGGTGGIGGTVCTGEVGRGGNGGAGGSGGNAGHGGGGAGGNSIAVLRELGATFNSTGTTLTAGAFGAGGSGPGNPGVDGVSAQDFSWGGTTPLTELAAPTATYALIVTDPDVPATPVTPLVADHAGFAYTFSIVSPALHGAAGVAGNQLTYNPQPGYFGSDSFVFRATRVGPGTTVDGYAVVVVLQGECVGPVDLDFNCDGFIDGLDVQIFVDRLLE